MSALNPGKDENAFVNLGDLRKCFADRHQARSASL